MLSDSSIQFSVKTAKDEKTGEVEELYKPMYMQVQKSRPRFVYPLQYEQDFPFNVSETIIERDTFSCNDDLNDPDPTCGWQHDDKGERIWHSQGFCCSCNAKHIILQSNAFLRGTKCEFMSFT